MRLFFRSSRLWIHAVIETAMLYEKCTAMALRPALTGWKMPRHWSFRSPVDLMMQSTDFTMKKCVFYDPSALTNLPLVAVSSLQLSQLLKILSLHYAICRGGETCSNVLIIVINNGCARVKKKLSGLTWHLVIVVSNACHFFNLGIIPLPWVNLILFGNEGVDLLPLFLY
ncbi:hypothetical protein T12_4413 [Trichinella patagoniensis]|uniref:Uncharacterized protein n=1 Tax=Trichinella patagoniensis TaxID=990121 RepID=A0A0V1AB32_9BILA|nr:hypothetical protein T12_4413 [Trichinella patagoniensis]